MTKIIDLVLFLLLGDKKNHIYCNLWTIFEAIGVVFHVNFVFGVIYI
jgi:hypothetical protein